MIPPAGGRSNFQPKTLPDPPSGFQSKTSNQPTFQISHPGYIYNFQPNALPRQPARVHSKSPQETYIHRPDLTPISCPRKIPSKYPSYAHFTKSHLANHLPHSQPNTHTIFLPTLLPLPPSLIHLTHGLYQAALAATQVTLYLPSRLDPNSGSSPRCIRVSSRAQG